MVLSWKMKLMSIQNSRKLLLWKKDQIFMSPIYVQIKLGYDIEQTVAYLKDVRLQKQSCLVWQSILNTATPNL